MTLLNSLASTDFHLTVGAFQDILLDNSLASASNVALFTELSPLVIILIAVQALRNLFDLTLLFMKPERLSKHLKSLLLETCLLLKEFDQSAHLFIHSLQGLLKILVLPNLLFHSLIELGSPNLLTSL